jgi:peptide/nickel transport system permease protein
MTRYIFKRILFFIPVLFVISLLNFALYSAAPGDPVTAMYSHLLVEGGDQVLTDEVLANMRARLGLDQPWPVRYGIWLGHVFQGDLGRSLISQRPVAEIIGKALWPTLQLNILAIVVGVSLGIGLGVMQGLRQYSLFDYIFSLLSYIYISLPGFFLALVLVYIFALQLGWLPPAGYETVGIASSWQDRARYLVLPVTTLALATAPGLMRYTRTAVLEVIRQPYTVTAKAKGLSLRAITWGHVVRNSLIPVVTHLGSILPGLIGGSVIIEQIFAWPGMGRLAIRAAYERDYPLLMGLVLLSSVILVISILLVDMLYAWVDPRIRYDDKD